MVTITALELEQWAQTYPSKFEFPRLIARLVWATCSDIVRVDIPGGEHVFLSGFDGIVECGRGNEFVPSGLSAWELGTEKDVTSKANEDYTKRTADSGDVDKAKAHFIFATPRRWSQCKRWEGKKDADRVWKQVLGRWSQHLEKWLDTVPWIAEMFARRFLRRPRRGLRTLELIWAGYANIPDPTRDQLGSQFVLAGRSRARSDLITWFRRDGASEDHLIRVSGASECEVLHFIAATIHALGEPDWTKFCSTVFTVDDVASAQSLRGITPAHIILATGNVVPHVVDFWRNEGCKLLVFHATDCKGPPPLRKLTSIELPPPARKTMLEMVVQAGYTRAEACGICEANDFDYQRVRKAVFLF